MFTERRSSDIKVAVLEQRIEQLEKRCNDKDRKIEALMAFQNRAIGYAMAASATGTMLAQYAFKLGS